MCQLFCFLLSFNLSLDGLALKLVTWGSRHLFQGPVSGAHAGSLSFLPARFFPLWCVPATLSFPAHLNWLACTKANEGARLYQHLRPPPQFSLMPALTGAFPGEEFHRRHFHQSNKRRMSSSHTKAKHRTNENTNKRTREFQFYTMQFTARTQLSGKDDVDNWDLEMLQWQISLQWIDSTKDLKVNHIL